MTLFLEPKALYNSPKVATSIPDDFEVPFGKARLRREGSDLSIITYGNTTPFCVELADRFMENGIASIDVLDLRSLSPLDNDAILATVKKTGKVLVVHEDKVFGGFGGELVALINEKDPLREWALPLLRWDLTVFWKQLFFLILKGSKKLPQNC